MVRLQFAIEWEKWKRLLLLNRRTYAQWILKFRYGEKRFYSENWHVLSFHGIAKLKTQSLSSTWFSIGFIIPFLTLFPLFKECILSLPHSYVAALNWARALFLPLLFHTKCYHRYHPNHHHHNHHPNNNKSWAKLLSVLFSPSVPWWCLTSL